MFGSQSEIRLTDLPLATNGPGAEAVCARQRECRRRPPDILISGQIYAVLSSNMTFKWLRTTSQFRHLCVQRFTMFFDAKYSILRKDSSLGKLGLFLVTCRNWRLSPSMILIVYIIFRISAGYAKRVEYPSCLPMILHRMDMPFPIFLSIESGNSTLRLRSRPYRPVSSPPSAP